MEKRKREESKFTETSDQASKSMVDKLHNIPQARAALQKKTEFEGETSISKRMKRDDGAKQSSQGTTAQAEVDYRLTLKPEGGMHCMGGMMLYVPEGAVKNDTPVTVSKRKGPMDSFGLPKQAWAMSDQIMLTPHELRYDKPVYLIFNHNLTKNTLTKEQKIPIMLLNKDTPESPWEITGSCQGQGGDLDLDKCDSKMALFSERVCIVKMDKNSVLGTVTWIPNFDGRRMFGFLYLQKQEVQTRPQLYLRFYITHDDYNIFESLKQHESDRGGDFVQGRVIQVATDPSKLLTAVLQLAPNSQWSPLTTSISVSPSILRAEWEHRAQSPIASIQLQTPAGVTPTNLEATLSVTQTGVPLAVETMREMNFDFNLPMFDVAQFQAIDVHGIGIEPQVVEWETVATASRRTAILIQNLTVAQAVNIASRIFPAFNAATFPSGQDLITYVVLERMQHWINDATTTRQVIIDFLHAYDVHNEEIENSL